MLLLTLFYIKKKFKLQFKQVYMYKFRHCKSFSGFFLTTSWAKVTHHNSLFNSLSLRMASWRWREIIQDFLLSQSAFQANSRTSSLEYSKIATK